MSTPISLPLLIKPLVPSWGAKVMELQGRFLPRHQAEVDFLFFGKNQTVYCLRMLMGAIIQNNRKIIQKNNGIINTDDVFDSPTRH